jgi:hypothetical protein
MDLVVDGESRNVHRLRSFDDGAAGVDPNEVGGPDLAEADAERIDPECVTVFRIAGGDVAGDALTEPRAAKIRKPAARRSFRCRRSSARLAKVGGANCLKISA